MFVNRQFLQIIVHNFVRLNRIWIKLPYTTAYKEGVTADSIEVIILIFFTKIFLIEGLLDTNMYQNFCSYTKLIITLISF